MQPSRLPQQLLQPMENDRPTYLETHEFLIRPSRFLFKKLNKFNNFLSISPTFRIDIWTRAYSTIRSCLYIRCNMGQRIWGYIWFTTKKNLNLKFFNTWRGAMASGNPIMNVKYRCNTQKHKKQEKMTRMRRRKKTWSCFVHLNTCIVTCSHYVHTCSLHNIE